MTSGVNLSGPKIAVLAARIAAAALFFAVAFGAAVISEAAGVTDRALKRAHAGVNTLQGDMIAEELNSATAMLETSWARPLRWHAGAIEAQSWIHTQRAIVDSDPAETRRFLNAGAHEAIRGVARAPVQPAAWARLAGLADAGADQTLCTVRECLNHSWRAARMAQAEVACSRLQIAYTNGLLRQNDVRIQWVARADYWGAVMRRCVAFMRPGDMFRALMIAEEDRAQREAMRRVRD